MRQLAQSRWIQLILLLRRQIHLKSHFWRKRDFSEAKISKPGDKLLETTRHLVEYYPNHSQRDFFRKLPNSFRKKRSGRFRICVHDPLSQTWRNDDDRARMLLIRNITISSRKTNGQKMPWPYTLCLGNFTTLWGEQAPVPTGFFGVTAEEEGDSNAQMSIWRLSGIGSQNTLNVI